MSTAASRCASACAKSPSACARPARFRRIAATVAGVPRLLGGGERGLVGGAGRHPTGALVRDRKRAQRDGLGARVPSAPATRERTLEQGCARASSPVKASATPRTLSASTASASSGPASSALVARLDRLLVRPGAKSRARAGDQPGARGGPRDRGLAIVGELRRRERRVAATGGDARAREPQAHLLLVATGRAKLVELRAASSNRPMSRARSSCARSFRHDPGSPARGSPSRRAPASRSALATMARPRELLHDRAQRARAAVDAPNEVRAQAVRERGHRALHELLRRADVERRHVEGPTSPARQARHHVRLADGDDARTGLDSRRRGMRAASSRRVEVVDDEDLLALSGALSPSCPTRASPARRSPAPPPRAAKRRRRRLDERDIASLDTPSVQASRRASVVRPEPRGPRWRAPLPARAASTRAASRCAVASSPSTGQARRPSRRSWRLVREARGAPERARRARRRSGSARTATSSVARAATLARASAHVGSASSPPRRASPSPSVAPSA